MDCSVSVLGYNTEEFSPGHGGQRLSIHCLVLSANDVGYLKANSGICEGLRRTAKASDRRIPGQKIVGIILTSETGSCTFVGVISFDWTVEWESN